MITKMQFQCLVDQLYAACDMNQHLCAAYYAPFDKELAEKVLKVAEANAEVCRHIERRVR